MKRTGRLFCIANLLVFLMSGVAVRSVAGVFISELCDPRLNFVTDRFVEIYNPGPDAVNLDGWQLVAVANGVNAFTWNLAGLMEPHSALVAGDATVATPFVVDFPAEAWSGSNGNWNGKVGDGAKLLDPLGTITDYVVATGTAFENADYVRAPEVDAPSPTYVPSQWTSTAVDLATGASPGTHQTAGPVDVPTLVSIWTEPAQPDVGEAVHVLADVTDAGAAIVSVLLAWGTAPDALGGSIALSLLAGTTYQTVSPIPPQAAGATVYYRVTAQNDLSGVTTSPLLSFELDLVATIAEIQGGVAVSPLDGRTVVTHGVVTASYGQTCVLQDGSGPWSGIWIRGTTGFTVGDSLVVRGLVSENASTLEAGNTMLVGAQALQTVPGRPLPAAQTALSGECGEEALEGVLLRVADAACIDPDLGGGHWAVNDGSGTCRIGALGGTITATLGTTYDVTGPLTCAAGQFQVEPRGTEDVVWTGDSAGPVLLRVTPVGETSLLAVFSEAVLEASAEIPAHYAIPGLSVTGARCDASRPDQVVLTITPMATGEYQLTVTGVADLFGNLAVTGATFHYYSPGIPAGFYDAAEGAFGQDLRTALHGVIDDHVAHSYDYAWIAYHTTDVRPDNGLVWDIYSDIPGGTPPYLYEFDVDQGGIGGQEGTGYTREHTWCKNWFGGEVSPMYTDLFALFPCDAHVNGTRGINPYGETTAPQLITQNGSLVGLSAVPGYTGTVFEPIDAFKGDLARVYFYFSTRYFGEDAGWPGGPATEGANLRPWALEMFRRWSEEDPVSLKEIERNNAVYLLQGNRNPFVDRPEFVERIYGPTPPPASPVVRLERQASGLMLLSWDAVTQPPATGYRIERGTGWPATVWTLAAETADTSWTDPLAPAVDSVGMYRVISLRAE